MGMREPTKAGHNLFARLQRDPAARASAAGPWLEGRYSNESGGRRLRRVILASTGDGLVVYYRGWFSSRSVRLPWRQVSAYAFGRGPTRGESVDIDMTSGERHGIEFLRGDLGGVAELLSQRVNA